MLVCMGFLAHTAFASPLRGQDHAVMTVEHDGNIAWTSGAGPKPDRQDFGMPREFISTSFKSARGGDAYPYDSYDYYDNIGHGYEYYYGELGVASVGPAKAPDSEVPGCQKSSVPIYVHYMVWWRQAGSGGHWDMLTGDLYHDGESQCPCVPEQSSDGTCAAFNRSVARTTHKQVPAFYPPIDGPYTSSDRESVRAHLMVMKEHCVAGVIVDFQLPETVAGQPNEKTQPIFIESTRAVAEVAASLNMKWALMYDQSSKAGDYNTVQVATDKDWSWIFSDDFIGGMSEKAQNAYLRHQGSKVFLSFGPSRFPSSSVRESCGKCTFVSQDGSENGAHEFDPTGYAGNGVFSWISPKSYNCGRGLGYQMPGKVTECKERCESWRSCNVADDTSKYWPERFYTGPNRLCIGAAFPGFRAVYSQHGAITRSVDLLKHTLQLCEEHQPFLCQVQTFNDLKEGTGIQPCFYCDKQGDAVTPPDAFLKAMKDFKR